VKNPEFTFCPLCCSGRPKAGLKVGPLRVHFNGYVLLYRTFDASGKSKEQPCVIDCNKATLSLK